MKPAQVALFLAAILSGQVMMSSATSWTKFAKCLKEVKDEFDTFNSDVFCAARQMAGAYRQMNGYNCKNCDKYFHCKGNYNAVNRCGQSEDAIRAAEAISDCREFSQGGMDADDGSADEEANRFGRELNDCEKEYLCKVNCKYNPRNRSCKRDNC